jgi:hypothetical protein
MLADVRDGVKMRRTRIEHISAGSPPITDIARRGGTAEKCHKQTHAVQQSTLSFDHFIGSQHQASRDFVPNRLRGPEIDD